jgi:DNA-binding CsgD family transcriptional regulator
MQDSANPIDPYEHNHAQSSNLREIPTAYLILTNESIEIWCAAIVSAKKLIGRSKQCDIVIPPKFLSVSRRHASIWGNPSGMMIRDEESTAGTRINGVEIGCGQEAKLVVGDRVSLGTLELQVTDNLPIQRKLFAETGVLIDESIDSVDLSGFTASAARTMLASLTKAEFSIVLWIGRGFFKDDEIAERLNRSPNTIRTQMNSIFRKLGVHSRTDLVNLIRYPQFDTDGIDCKQTPSNNYVADRKKRTNDHD